MRGRPDVVGLGRLARHEQIAAVAERFPTALDRFVRPRRHAQRALVKQALADDVLLERFARAEYLPTRYGIGLDERVVEHPWVVATQPTGRTLDAGSALNHAHVLARVCPLVDELHIVTLAPERKTFRSRRISYVYADLRELPYRDGYFDTTVSVSTLEHVGMDNRVYGDATAAAAKPLEEVRRALAELRRVTTRGGRILITVPYGVPEHLGWLRQFSAADLDAVVDAVQPTSSIVTIFRYTRDGWQLSDEEAAANARYRLPELEPKPPDLAARARAVACLALAV